MRGLQPAHLRSLIDIITETGSEGCQTRHQRSARPQMATHDSPRRQPPPGKKTAPPGTWSSPDRPMAVAPADPTVDHRHVQRQGPGLRAPQGREALHKRPVFGLLFRLRSGGALNQRGTTMSARTVDAVWWKGRGLLPWRPPGPGAVVAGSSTCVFRHDTASKNMRAAAE